MKPNSRRILCVEDDIDTCQMLTFTLGRSGYEVVSVHTYADAAKALTDGFDLYIIDGRLPDGNGVDLCKQIRKLDARTPILFTSGDNFSLQNEMAVKAGAQAYFVKPIMLDDMERAVEKLLSE